jgi:signal transduction histidine kinase
VIIRILHVEDDAHDRELVEETLRAAGVVFEIVRADGRETFESALSRSAFDVILADDRLPSFDGETALAMAVERAPDTPFIVVSGTLGEEVAVARLKAGATDYVLKQRLSRLPSAIARAMSEARMRAGKARAEAEVRRLNAALEARVLERTAQLADANRALAEQDVAVRLARDEAERANRAKSDFLSRMSHDLRTPLNAVLGFAQILAADSPSASQQECVQQILAGGRHLLDLINEVLDITRIEAGHLSLSPEPVGVGDIARHATALVAPLAAERGIDVALEEGPLMGGAVMADRQRLNQILLNLLSNAVKYNRPRGRVTVSVEAGAPGRLRIRVRDSGAGIPPEKVKLLFRPFERLGAELTTIEGTGLGLTLSRGLAEAMGGSIGVDSAVDRGSTFWVELASTPEPAAAAEIPAAPAGWLPEPAAPGTASILYIEDNISNVRLMTRLLRSRPAITLHHAPTGEDGLAHARTRPPDLILLDLHLPDIPGEEVLRQVWGDPALRHIPVVALSADATDGQIRRMLASGAAAYLTKPLDLHAALALVDRLLASAAAARQS